MSNEQKKLQLNMDNFDDAKNLIIHSKEMIKKIEISYSESLNEKEIRKSLLIDIKNLMENLRSALDFTAQGLFNKYGSSNKAKPKIYFPYATIKTSKVIFQRKKIIENKIPGLENHPDLIKAIESYQHFENQNNKWLPIFMELNNENKHLKLSPQSKQEQKQLIIVSENKGFPIGIGGKIKMEKGSRFQFGDAIIEGEQTFNAENPPKISGGGYSIVKSWISFHFNQNKIEVLPFLKEAFNGTEKIVEELSKI